MKLSIDVLKKFKPCRAGMEWYEKNSYQTVEDTVTELIKINHLDWANWLLSRCLTSDNKIRYAIYAAEKSLHFYTDKYHDDDRPQKAISAAKNYLKEKTTDAADAVADAADAVADALATVYVDAEAAADAADTVADAVADALAATVDADVEAAADAVRAVSNAARTVCAAREYAVADATFKVADAALYTVISAVDASEEYRHADDINVMLTIINYGLSLIV